MEIVMKQRIPTIDEFVNEANKYSEIKSISDDEFDALIRNWNDLVDAYKNDSDPYRRLMDGISDYAADNFKGKQRRDVDEYIEKVLVRPPYKKFDRQYPF